jgi:hypothetical protein
VLWTVVHDGPGAGPEFGRSVLLDAAGNIYVGAASYGGPATNNDMTVLRFDAGGAFQWETLIDGSGHAADSGAFLAFDPSGNIAVAGQLASSSTNGNIGVALVTPAGAILWQRERDGAAHAADFGLAVACDAAGSVYVAGWSTNVADQDPTLLKYDAAGNLAWALDWAEPAGNGQFRDVAVDARGRIDVVGHSPGAGTGLDLITAQFDATGAPNWDRRYDGAAHSDDTSRALYLDSASNVVVCGYSNGPSLTTADADTVVIRYDSAGVERWVHTGIYASNEDRAMDVVQGPGGRIVYGAYLKNTSYDMALVALDEQGVPYCFGDGSATPCPCGQRQRARRRRRLPHLASPRRQAGRHRPREPERRHAGAQRLGDDELDRDLPARQRPTQRRRRRDPLRRPDLPIAAAAAPGPEAQRARLLELPASRQPTGQHPRARSSCPARAPTRSTSATRPTSARPARPTCRTACRSPGSRNASTPIEDRPALAEVLVLLLVAQHAAQVDQVEVRSLDLRLAQIRAAQVGLPNLLRLALAVGELVRVEPRARPPRRGAPTSKPLRVVPRWNCAPVKSAPRRSAPSQSMSASPVSRRSARAIRASRNELPVRSALCSEASSRSRRRCAGRRGAPDRVAHVASPRH